MKKPSGDTIIKTLFVGWIVFMLVWSVTYVGMASTVGYEYSLDTSAHLFSAKNARSVNYALEQINATIEGMEENNLGNDSHYVYFWRTEDTSMHKVYEELYGIQFRLMELKSKEVGGNYTFLDYSYEFKEIKDQINQVCEDNKMYEKMTDACYIENNWGVFLFMSVGGWLGWCVFLPLIILCWWKNESY